MAQSLTARGTATVALLVLAQSDGEAVSARQTIEALSHGCPVHGIVVAADQARPDRLRALIQGLARGDLPLVLWRPTGLPAADDPSLAWVEHLVVDSRTGTALPALVEITGRLPVTDLAWIDLAQGRELVAALFQGPDFGPFLGAVRHVRVQGDESFRRLLVGWLLGRLRILPSAVEVRASEHASIEITAEHDGRRAHFSVVWSADPALIDARAVVGGGPSQVRRVHPADPSTTRLLARALLRLHRDPFYTEALTAALTLRSGPGPGSPT